MSIMRTLIHAQQLLAAALLSVSTLCSVQANPLIADWQFDESAGKTLNQTTNSGSGLTQGVGSGWDVAISDVLTTGNGLLAVRNTAPYYSSPATRTAYADLGPYPDSVDSGSLSLYASFAGWSLLGAQPGLSFSLGFIEGNSFLSAGFSLRAGSQGLWLSGEVDAFGDGQALGTGSSFGWTLQQPLTVRLDLHLDSLSYSLFYDAGQGFVGLGGAPIDSFTLGVNSLRLSLDGDFSVGGQAGSGLWLDRIWVASLPAVPEPPAALLLLAGLVLLGRRRLRR